MQDLSISVPKPQTTGKFLVLLDDDEVNEGVRAISNATGIQDFARPQDFQDNAISPSLLAGTDAFVLDELGVAVVSLQPDQVQSLNQAVPTTNALITVEPERIVYAITEPGNEKLIRTLPAAPSSIVPANIPLDYLKGYRDGINHLIDHLIGLTDATAPVQEIGVPPLDPGYTWGLQLTKVSTSGYSGLGIRVAVLDTGLDLTHPDFAGRSITSKSFVEGEEVQDGNGHGTHCIGTACGPQTPETLPRYGVAFNCEIYAGKVLSNAGSGEDGGILAGIDWAIANGCQVISMSLGAPVEPGQSYSQVYERVGRRALRRGTLIVAAAGNDSRRPGRVVPVSHPANCPSIMAVAALDQNLQVAFFSNGGLNIRGGQIDIAGPGVDVYSTWYLPDRYKTISGTSMATPHVAGIAALFAEATGNTGRALWAELTQSAQRLSLPSRDVGSGLVQAVQ